MQLGSSGKCKCDYVAKEGTQILFVSPQIENSWAHSASANPQIFQVCQSANRKSANLQGKKQYFWSRSALVYLYNIFIYLRNYISDYAMPRICPNGQKSSLNFIESILSLWRKDIYLWICGVLSPKKQLGPQIHQSQKIYGPQICKYADFRFSELTVFADRQPLHNTFAGMKTANFPCVMSSLYCSF
jgi:hypothetical protein